MFKSYLDKEKKDILKKESTQFDLMHMYDIKFYVPEGNILYVVILALLLFTEVIFAWHFFIFVYRHF